MSDLQWDHLVPREEHERALAQIESLKRENEDLRSQEKVWGLEVAWRDTKIEELEAAAITPEMRERMVNEAASLALGYATAHWMTQASLGLDITKSEISELHESWERSGAVRDLLGEQG